MWVLSLHTHERVVAVAAAAAGGGGAAVTPAV